jgi:hypothetical protein
MPRNHLRFWGICALFYRKSPSIGGEFFIENGSKKDVLAQLEKIDNVFANIE